MGEACHNFEGPPRTHGQARMEATQQTTTTPQAYPQEPEWNTRSGVATQVTMRVVVITPLKVTPSLASARYPDWYAPLERYISYGADQAKCAVEGVG
jgi:hypothetical protein